MEIKFDAPLATVIIVNYNSGGRLLECVTSVIESTYNTEIVVVDNASSDDSVIKIEDRFSAEPTLRIIYNKENMGFSKAINKGISAAKGEYFFCLNPDCVLEENTLSVLLSSFICDGEEKVGMVGGLVLDPDGTEQAGGRRAVPTPWRTFIRVTKLSSLANRYPRLFADFDLHKQPLPNEPVEVEAISGACMLVSRKAYEDVGGMDEEYFLHCEDLDWCMVFRKKSWKILFVPHARLVHHQGSCSKARPIFVEWHKHKGMMRFYRKFFRHQYPGALMWLVGVAVWVRFSLLAGYYTAARVIRFFKHDHS